MDVSKLTNAQRSKLLAALKAKKAEKEMQQSYKKTETEVVQSIKSLVDAIPPKKGDKGDRGEKGDRGDKGEQGLPGKNGLNGKDGKNGINGKDGKDGLNGKDGRDGIDGLNGYTPRKGYDYFDGRDGKDGKDGKDGRDGIDGSADTPAEIVVKLKTLKGEERLPASAVKGLDRIFAPINWAYGSITLDEGDARYFKHTGNSFGANAVLGTNDNYSLSFETNGTTRATIDTSGGLFLYPATGASRGVNVSGTIDTSSGGYQSGLDVSLTLTPSVAGASIYPMSFGNTLNSSTNISQLFNWYNLFQKSGTGNITNFNSLNDQFNISTSNGTISSLNMHRMGYNNSASSGTNTITSMAGVYTEFIYSRGAHGTIYHNYMYNLQSGTATTTNLYGLFVDNMTAGSTLNYAIYTNLGLVRFGDQLLIDGGADRSQFILEMHSTQTTNPFILRTSAASNVFQINSIGNVGIKTNPTLYNGVYYLHTAALTANTHYGLYGQAVGSGAHAAGSFYVSVGGSSTFNGSGTVSYLGGADFRSSTGGSVSSENLWGVYGFTSHSSSGSISGSIRGLWYSAYNSGSGTVPETTGAYVEVGTFSTRTSTVQHGVWIDWTNSGTVTTGYGLRIDDITATTAYAIYTGAGRHSYGGAIEYRAVTTSTSASVTLNTTNYMLRADATSNNITVNLPTAVGITGRTYVVKKIDSSVNTVTLDGNSSETIDGATTQVLSSQYDAITIISNGTNWDII